MPKLARCKWCGTTEPSAFYVSRPNDCKACMSLNQKKARAADPEKFRKRSKRWSDANREAVRENSRNWYLANRDRKLAVAKQWVADNRERSNALHRRWHRENPEKVAKIMERHKQKDPGHSTRYSRRWAEKHPERAKAKARRSSLRFHYGITPEQFSATMASQGGLCAICSREISESRKRSAHQDHHHASGRLRGILCAKCNLGLGAFCDSPELLRSAIDYLADHHPEVLSA